MNFFLSEYGVKTLCGTKMHFKIQFNSLSNSNFVIKLDRFLFPNHLSKRIWWVITPPLRWQMSYFFMVIKKQVFKQGSSMAASGNEFYPIQNQTKPKARENNFGKYFNYSHRFGIILKLYNTEFKSFKNFVFSFFILISYFWGEHQDLFHSHHKNK